VTASFLAVNVRLFRLLALGFLDLFACNRYHLDFRFNFWCSWPFYSGLNAAQVSWSVGEHTGYNTDAHIAQQVLKKLESAVLILNKRISLSTGPPRISVAS